jgi:hypothetical protein
MQLWVVQNCASVEWSYEPGCSTCVGAGVGAGAGVAISHMTQRYGLLDATSDRDVDGDVLAAELGVTDDTYSGFYNACREIDGIGRPPLSVHRRHEGRCGEQAEFPLTGTQPSGEHNKHRAHNPK